MKVLIEQMREQIQNIE
ncbi:MAG: hypothetical protein ACE1ZG_07865 [Gammaproteobacteria bacterium]